MYRVLHIVSRMGYGGIEALLMNIYRNIDKNEVQFDFTVSSKLKGEYDDEIRNLGGTIYYLPKRNKKIFKYKKEWDKFLKENASKYNAIQMHVSSLTNITPIKIAKKYGIKNIFIHAHNTYQKGLIHNILNRVNQLVIHKYTTRLFACSTEAGKYCYGKNKFENINNGIDTKMYKYSTETRDKNRKKMSIDQNEIALVHVGRFNEQKNHDFLIDIFNDLLKKQKNYTLFLVGDGGLKSQIIEKVKNLGIENKVKFLGLRNDVNEILQAMDIFLLPSLHEGLPVVGIEAQAAGLKCIMSENISKEVKITDLVTFLPIDNTERWIKSIIDNKKYNRKDVQEQIVQAGYDITKTAQKLEKYYKQ